MSDQQPDPSVAQTVQKLNEDIPYGVRVAAGWSWRSLVIIAGVAVALWLFSHLSLLIIPLLAAALLSAFLMPMHLQLMRWGIPAALSVLITLLTLIGAVSGLLVLVGRQLALGFVSMRDQVMEGLASIMNLVESKGWITTNYDDLLKDVTSTLKDNSDVFVSSALGFGSTASNVVVGTVMALFALIFFLKDGRRMWSFFLKAVPERHRRAINGAGEAGWRSVSSYVRIQILVAFVDALGIGLGAWILGVPLALPLGVLVFLASFIPFVGAILTGAIAVLLALVTNGLTNALLMLLVVLIVQQVESNVLQPLLMGKAVSLHPLAVFLVVAAGTALLGIVGAVFAVPVLAFINAFIQYLAAKPWLKIHDPYAIDTKEPL